MVVPPVLRRGSSVHGGIRFSILSCSPPAALMKLTVLPRHHILRPLTTLLTAPLPLSPLPRRLPLSALLAQSRFLTTSLSTAHATPPTNLPSPSFPTTAVSWRKGRIPPICPGCGAPSQSKDRNQPGFYDLEKLKKKKEPVPRKVKRIEEEQVWRASMDRYESVLREMERKLEEEQREEGGDRADEVEGKRGLHEEVGERVVVGEGVLKKMEESLDHGGMKEGRSKYTTAVEGGVEIPMESGKHKETQSVLEELELKEPQMETVREMEAKEERSEVESQAPGVEKGELVNQGNASEGLIAEQVAARGESVAKGTVSERVTSEQATLESGLFEESIVEKGRVASSAQDAMKELPGVTKSTVAPAESGSAWVHLESQAPEKINVDAFTETAKQIAAAAEQNIAPEVATDGLRENLPEEEENAFSEVEMSDLDSEFDKDNFEFKTTDTSKDEPRAEIEPFSVVAKEAPPSSKRPTVPLCSRCLSLLHHNTGSILHTYPDLDTLIELINESKHEMHHIYHLIDAVDYPLSLIPRLRSYLTQFLPHKKAKYLTVSYIVTRADLLMPKESQITSLMTYLKTVLKEALPAGEPIEDHYHHWGGSFRAVSIRNGWSVRKVKAEFSEMATFKMSYAEKGKVKRREGAIWIVGKVNVGKSRFVGEIVPEGSFTNLERVIETAQASHKPDVDPDTLTGHQKIEAFLAQVERQERANNPERTNEELERILEQARIKLLNDELSQEDLPLVAPTVSHIPGTTVAPVRVAFRHPANNGAKGSVKGEIIDLPGMERGRFLEYVRPEVRKYVQMRERVNASQYVVKPGQSLLLAGLIMITPKLEDTAFMMYPFTTLPAHVSSTEKVLKLMCHPDPASSREPILFQHKPSPSLFTSESSGTKDTVTVDTGTVTQEDGTPTERSGSSANVPRIPQTWKDPAVPVAPPPHIKSAGSFPLAWDVTKSRNPLLAKRTDLEIELIPYKIYSTDILLEGIGWVEVVAQVRGRHLINENIPEVEVLSPLGKGVGNRIPMGADMLRIEGMKSVGKHGERRPLTIGRRREPMKGRKKESKRRHNLATGGGK
ncbi:hypothetical protein BDZ91DRAFT_708495 [Kalaharituber pfeilii]|nr:hypothetical protein BDZ91DRAFT_708495 [Kalaharituber pfeilii]